MRRRRIEVFSLSFLDCICCGFGAVVLFYTIVAGQAGIKRVDRTDQLQAEVNKLEEEVLVGTRNLVVLRNTLQKTEVDTRNAAARAQALLDEVSASRAEALRVGATSMAQREHINRLKSDLKQLEEGNRRLQAGALQKAPAGERVRAFRGSGNRRYLTGINVKGRRVLVLLDRSASSFGSPASCHFPSRSASSECASVLNAYIWNWLPAGICVEIQSAMSSAWRHFGAERRAATGWLRSLMMLTRSSST